MTFKKMIAATALTLVGSGAATATDASLRINITATIPVACSNGQAISRSVSGSSVIASFDARCNAPHELQVLGAGPNSTSVSVNQTEVAVDDQNSVSVLRGAYFDQVTVVTVRFDSEEEAAQVADSLMVRLSPIA